MYSKPQKNHRIIAIFDLAVNLFDQLISSWKYVFLATVFGEGNLIMWYWVVYCSPLCKTLNTDQKLG